MTDTNNDNEMDQSGLESSSENVDQTDVKEAAPADQEQQSANEPYEFSDLQGSSDDGQPANLDFILDIPLEITVELGRTKMMIHNLLQLGQGSVIELAKPAGDTLEILANDRLIAKGDVVVMNDKYGIRLTEVISPVERLENLK